MGVLEAGYSAPSVELCHCFSFSRTPALSLAGLVASGAFWLLSLNPTNTAKQLLATDANRGRVAWIVLLAQAAGRWRLG